MDLVLLLMNLEVSFGPLTIEFFYLNTCSLSLFNIRKALELELARSTNVLYVRIRCWVVGVKWK